MAPRSVARDVVAGPARSRQAPVATGSALVPALGGDAKDRDLACNAARKSFVGTAHSNPSTDSIPVPCAITVIVCVDPYARAARCRAKGTHRPWHGWYRV